MLRRHTHQHEWYGSSMASKKRTNATSQMKPVKGYAKGGSKPSSKGRTPASKKEKLLGAELGKTGRAAERGKPVTNAQKGLGNYSRQTMQNKRMRDMPVKQKLEAFGVGLVVGAATDPGTLRGKPYYGVHGSPTSGLKKIEPRIGASSAKTNQTIKGLYGEKAVPGKSVYTYPLKSDEAIKATGYGRGGETYIVKGRQASTTTPAWNPAERLTSTPMKVVGRMPSTGGQAELDRLVKKTMLTEISKTVGVRAATSLASGVVSAAAVKKNRNKRK